MVDLNSTKTEVDLYLKAREKEGRLYSDELVTHLPSISNIHPLSNEWLARSASALRLTKYLSRQTKLLKILDVGCGNGWLSNLLYKSGHDVVGIDQNHYELKQAARVFSSNPKLSFLDVNIFSAPFAKETFDVILLASVIQYFPNLSDLIKTLFHYLKPQGEIHIIDTPFYSDTEFEDAVRRSEKYYSLLGFPEMSKYYFHHRINDLNFFRVKWMYRPNTFVLRVKRLFGKVNSPFAWIVIKK